MYMLFMSGIILGFLLSFHVHYRLCRLCDHVFSILLLSANRAGDSSFGTRYHEVSEDEVGGGGEKKNAKELSSNLDCDGTGYFCCYRSLENRLLQENKISFEMYFTFIFPLVIGLITIISFLSSFMQIEEKSGGDSGDPSGE